MEDSTPRTPLVFILSPGVDPTSALLQLAEHTGMAQRFHVLSLGQGQAPIAARLLREGVIQGPYPSGSSTPSLGASSLSPRTVTSAPTSPEAPGMAELGWILGPSHPRSQAQSAGQMGLGEWFPLSPASSCRTLGVPSELPPVTVVDA